MPEAFDKIAIVLVNYNGATYVDACIKSIEQQFYTNYEIIVVDNQSVDGSGEMIEENYSKIHVIYAEENGGWGYGCNLGAEYAVKNGADYILFLNLDTEVEKDMIECLIKYADSKTVTVPTMYAGSKGNSRGIWYAGGKIDYTKATVSQTVYSGIIAECTENMTKEVDFITGCCMLVHKDIWAKVGGFNCNYFMYYEDVDYSIRLTAAGIKILFVPSAVLYHKVGGIGGGEISYLTEYYMVRNRLFFSKCYKEYMQVTTLDVLQCILQERNYFQTYSYQPYKQFAIAGIKDFFKGIMGREENLFGNGFVVKCGFYDKEKNETDSWYWGSERVSEIEIRNPYNSIKVMSIISAIYLPKDVQRSFSLYVNKKMIYSLQLPEVLHYECILLPKEKVNLSFVTTEPSLVEGDGRGLTFQMANPEVVFRDLE